jgi:hypothetical protein
MAVRLQPGEPLAQTTPKPIVIPSKARNLQLLGTTKMLNPVLAEICLGSI